MTFEETLAIHLQSTFVKQLEKSAEDSSQSAVSCFQCTIGLITMDGTRLPSKQVGDFLLCRHCYDLMVMAIAQELGVHQILADRLEMQEATKKWKEKL